MKPKQGVVTLLGLCVVFSTIRVIIALLYREYNESLFIYIVNIFNALLWTAAFIKWRGRYRACQARDESSDTGDGSLNQGTVL